MKKTIKLTEYDLSNLVRKVLKESETRKQYLSEEPSKPGTPVPLKKPQNIVTSINFNSLWSNFPKNSSAYEIFPIIFPKEYEKFPDSFGNACATRLSLALNKLGVKPLEQFKTQQVFEYDGVSYPKGLPITTMAKDSPEYLKNKFGPPSFDGENTQENIDKELKGKKGIFVITNIPGWSASGHADIFYDANVNSLLSGISGYNTPKFNCGHSCYFGEGGKIQAWFVK
jgi:hypothetical protein